MNNNVLEKAKDAAISAAQAGGDVLMEHYHQALVIDLKEALYDAPSIVTEADRRSEAEIIRILTDKFPDFGLYGEESQGVNMNADYVWYVDPLDGTSNFTRHIPLFGISLGLVHLGQPVVGVLYFPALNLLVSATAGGGCAANGKLVQVSNRSLPQSLYYAGGKSKGQQRLNLAIGQECGLVKIIDSSSFEFAQIAMGDAEIYYLDNVPHDVVAGICIVREAGGKVTDGDGNNWHLGSATILATNSCHHDVLVDKLRHSVM